MMPDPQKPSSQPRFNADTIQERLKTASSAVKFAAAFAQEFDWLGDAAAQPKGSEQRALAEVRDAVDRALGFFLVEVMGAAHNRARNSRNVDLLSFVSGYLRGDGAEALSLMERIHELFGDESGPDGGVSPETFPDSFAWDTYLRVSALAGLVEKYPKHLRHGARQMHGWPMIVSHHLDCRAEFERIAERLEVGAAYPLDVGPRKKRGVETALFRYLEPMVFRLHVLRGALLESAETRGGEDFVRRIYYFWWQHPEPEPGPEEMAILQRLPSLPPLTQETAREWSREVIVPLILLEGAGTRETCKEPALRKIWQHRSVKSRATFQSRLHSAVTDTLQRFGRAE